jgi:Zn-dependent protease/CBS domain-containing protein
MFGRKIPLFRLFGFSVGIDASWFIIAALIVWSLAMGVFPQQVPGLARSTYWWMGIVGALGFFGSIVIHELFHSLVARRFNLPMNGITLFVFGGVAEMGGEPQNPKVEFLMAIAGPITSVILAFLFRGLAHAGNGIWPDSAVAILSYLGWINLLLAVFNMIPAFPLDGGRVLRSALWHFQGNLQRATRIASAIGTGFAVFLMVVAVWELFAGSFISAMWLFLIGMFLQKASQASYRQVVIRAALAGEQVKRFMHSGPITVPPGISIQQLVDDYIYRYHFKMFPVVTSDDRLEGCITTRDVKSIPREEWPQHRVEEVVKPCSDANTISPDADALNALSKMQETGQSRLLVTDRDRHLLAVVSIKDLVRFLASKLELEGGPPQIPHARGI